MTCPFHSCIFGGFGANNNVKWNHFISRITICFIIPPLQLWLNHLTLHWIICVWLEPLNFVNVCVNSYFTQTIMQQSSWPLVIKLDHVAHGILMDYYLTKLNLVWRYCFNIYEWTASHVTKIVCSLHVGEPFHAKQPDYFYFKNDHFFII